MSKSGVFVCVCRCMVVWLYGCVQPQGGCFDCVSVCESVCGSGTGMDNILIRAWQVDNEHLEQTRTQLSGRRKASGRTQFMRDNYTNSG